MQNTEYKRTYVKINKNVYDNGKIEPLLLYWQGTAYEISSYKLIGRRAAQSAGGVGILYVCNIEGKERKLYCELRNETERWFVEEKLIIN